MYHLQFQRTWNWMIIAFNGAITFGSTTFLSYPELRRVHNIIAPFWSYMDPNDRSQGVYYHLYEELRTTGTSFSSPQLKNVLERATKNVKSYYRQAAVDNFKASTVLLATWENVKPYTWYSGYCSSSRPCNYEVEQNTFQVIFATDGVKSYAIFIYKHGSMTWQYVVNRRIVVGFSNQNNVEDLGVTYTKLTVDMDKLNGTSGQQGIFFYKVGEVETSAQKCVKFYLQNRGRAESEEFKKDMRELFECPCSRNKLGRQWRFYERRGVNRNIDCYAIDPVHMRLRFPGNTLNKLCCYQFFNDWPFWNYWWLNYQLASYLSGTPDSGHIITRNPFSDKRKLIEEDIMPKSWCCRESSLYDCTLFHLVRPDLRCSTNAEIVTGTTSGDPHITTLDNRQYTMNGWGEYILIEGSNFTLQGRTDRLEITNGTFSNATVFVAFAARELNKAKFQVQLSVHKTAMVIFADGFDITNEFYMSENFTKELANFTVWREAINNRTSVVASFTSGISLAIFIGIENLEVIIEANKELKGEIRGLLGNFNGVETDDFVLANGTVLPQSETDSDRKIFNNFGKHWEVNATNSIFLYGPRERPEDFQHSDFIPIFLDEVDNKTREEAYNICGFENIACIFDYVATNDKKFAEYTKNTVDVSQATRSAIENNLPTISIIEGLSNNSQWEVVAGQMAYLTITSEDTDNDHITYRLVNSIDQSAYIHPNGTIAYNPHIDKPVNIEVQAVDAKNGSSSILTITVAVCPNCSGNGECDKNVFQESKSDNNFLVYSCDCKSAYTGENCDLDYDACSDSPCASGQNCTDMTPGEQGNSTVGYVCGACPGGFENTQFEEFKVCTDINECNNTEHCEQNCTNTEGSYFCSCTDGYRLNPDLHTCIDIDECVEKSHKCEQNCVNLPGGFKCQCFEGFNENCTLDATEQTKCEAAKCTDLCHVVNGTARCLCRSGYKLKEDNKTCENINECSDNRKYCSQLCTDTQGSFNCSCYSGFRLAPDRTSCEACEPSFWGPNCAHQCQCSGHGVCHPVRGCVCHSGWKGSNCNDDIDECTDKLHNCTSIEICQNRIPGYICQCLNGYERQNGVCSDVDECSDVLANDCNTTHEICQNLRGGYTCYCKAGYIKNTANGQCEDIDECLTDTHKCNQLCVNSLGSYYCKCHYGYDLTENRLDCIKGKNVCEGMNCSHGCTIDLYTNVSMCFCNAGYELDHDNITCKDVNECNQSHSCSSGAQCANTVPGYECICSTGTRLDNNGRSCINCSAGTWGDNCNMSCACASGAEYCDSIVGCVCKPGFNGTFCEEDIDQCESLNCSQYDNQTCLNRIGPDSCECRSGFHNVTGQCQDINECEDFRLNTCSHDCINLPGSYNCSCADGFYISDFSNCHDIDECTSNRSLCEYNCINTVGNYLCFCRDGFQISSNGFSCIDINECSDSVYNNCTVNQTCYNNEGDFICSCKPGYFLDINDCKDIDECLTSASNNCTVNQTCNNNEGGFSCSCKPSFSQHNGGCKEQMNKNISITFNYNASGVDLNNSSSDSYNKLKEAFESWISRSLKDNMSDLYSAEVVTMQNGSLIVNLSLVLWNIPLKDYKKQVFNGLVYLNQKNGTVLGQPVKLISFVIEKESGFLNQTLCEIFPEEFCREVADDKLTLGLAIGIPLFVMLIVGTVAAVLIWKKKKTSSLLKNASNSFETDDGVFAKSIAKYGSWSKPETYQQPYDDQSWSSNESSSKRINTKYKKQEKDKENSEGNFSWDLIYKALQPLGEDYKIQRPKVTPGYTSKI